MAGAIKKELKRRFCSRDLEPGDVVRVPDARWEPIDHPLGGNGKWAIFVGRTRSKFVVRPLNNGVTGPPQEVAQAEHLDDVVQEAALRLYYSSRTGKKG